MRLERRDDGVRVERLVIVEAHAAAQIELHLERRNAAPGRREPGLHRAFRVDVDQRIVDSRDKREALGIERLERREPRWVD
jgi:hypothetical protein